LARKPYLLIFLAIIAVLALIPLVSAANTDCELLLQYLYKDNKTLFKIEEALNEEAHPLNAKILRQLEESGGHGTLVNYTAGPDRQSFQVVRVDKAPTKVLYAKAFNDIFSKMKRYDIPLLLTSGKIPDYRRSFLSDTQERDFLFDNALAYVHHYRSFSSEAKAIAVFDIDEITSSIMRHEYQHLIDIIINPKSFAESFKFSKKTKELIQQELKEVYPKEFSSMHMVALTRALLETRAYGLSLKSLATRQGWKEIFLDPSISKSLRTLLSDSFRRGPRFNNEAFKASFYIDPLNPHNIIYLFKASPHYIRILSIPLWIIAGYYTLIDLAEGKDPAKEFQKRFATLFQAEQKLEANTLNQ